MRAEDCPLPTVEVFCSYCSRCGRYKKERFVKIAGGGTDLPQALGVIVADCQEERVTPGNMRGNSRPRYAQNWWAAASKALR
ncbi:hypothetical protein METH_09515 [Leisingera methylohalidivorans DSM 14336]|uniref:Uncharacterized protein n=2 Tax=Leisingera methylohalidivorans TaxID=133924 RepID=V9VYL1_9RHOB|nr:hypothetical protein METH_09515 [Leisingera methylohalidivorans DSM 14336]